MNSRVVPEGLRPVVEEVVCRFTFGRPMFRWMPTPSADVVLSMPPVIAESFHCPREEDGKWLREGIEEEIRDAIERLLPFAESSAVEAQQ